MEKPLHSTTLYKSGDATMTVYQGKAKKTVIILSTLHPGITVADKSKKIPERVKAYIDKNMVWILSIKWQMESNRIFLMISFNIGKNS